MRRNRISRKLGMVGTGVGVTLFLLYGVTHGALIGGTAGLKAGAVLAGMGEMMPRLMGGFGMLLGILVAALFMIGGGFAVGRLVGQVVGIAEAAGKHDTVTGVARN
jgi:hypothetical protein